MAEERNTSERIMRQALEAEFSKRLANTLNVDSRKIILDIAPLTRKITSDTNNLKIYFRLLDEPYIAKNPIVRVLKRDVINPYELKTHGKLVSFDLEREMAFKKVPEGSMYLESRSLEELLAMETGASVPELKQAIINLHNNSKRILNYLTQNYDGGYRYKLSDVSIKSYEDSPLVVINKGVLNVKYNLIHPVNGVSEWDISIHDKLKLTNTNYRGKK